MRRWLLASLTILVVGVGSVIYFSYQNSLGKVVISIDPAASAKIVKQTGENPVRETTVRSFQTNFNGKLKKGSYLLVTSAGADYSNVRQGFTVGPTTTALSVKLNYSDAKLAQLATTQVPDINAVFNAQYPGMAGRYSLQKIFLYGRGDWAGALVVPTDPNQDTLRVIFQKANNQCKVATVPPVISIGYPVYPNIPRALIVQANNLK